jgi:hypothetical protein
MTVAMGGAAKQLRLVLPSPAFLKPLSTADVLRVSKLHLTFASSVCFLFAPHASALTITVHLLS